jgi:nucleoside-triphosphatase THEP1
MIVVLTGDVGSGKTTLLAGLLDILKSLSMSADGFLGVRVFEKDRFSGYDLVDVRDGRRLPFLRRAEGAGTAAVGPWRLVDSSLAAAAEIIRTSRPNALLVVDELGPLELEGGGHWPALAAVLDQPGRRFLFVIREACLADFIRKFAGRTVKIKTIHEGLDVRTLAEEIATDVHDR